MNGWADFEWWRARYDADDVGFDEPFADQPWSADTSFLWAKTIEPVGPGLGAPSGFWSVFPHPGAAAGALRFVLLPDWFGAWLGRDDWDEQPDQFRPAEDILAAAETQAPEDVRDDVPLMREILTDLDALLAESDAAIIVERLTPILEKVNSRWHGTGSWDFYLDLFHGPEAVGNELAARRTEYLGDEAAPEQVAEALGMSRDAWLQLCAHSISDPEARESLQDALEDDSF